MRKVSIRLFYRCSLAASFVFLIITLIMLSMGYRLSTGPFAFMISACLAIYVRGTRHFKGLAFTLWVLAAVTACMYYPNAFTNWGGFELSKLIVPLIQLIMFGMGTTLCIKDFTRVIKMPRAIFIGMVLQFSVMPLAGLMLAKAFGFDPMIAVGIILVGSCPGGVASNVITYLARGNVALSVTMTACSTLVSPLMTPLAMKILAQQYTHIDFVSMMISIVKMIILPIIAGLIANKLLHKFSKWRDRVLPVFSMLCLCFIITIITSLSRDRLLTVGFALIIVAIIHNVIGYIVGYFGARLLKLDETSCRTIAIEVGLQNGGMASGIAMNVLNSVEAGLAPAIFGPWMNVSGSILASFWRRKPAKKTTSRSNIYYWKCDNKLPVKEKLVYNDKYKLADISELVNEIAVGYFGHNNLSVVSANGEGNHYTYTIKVDDKSVFFRADDGKIDDDYMDAEVAAMNLVRKYGVCVPQVYHCDTSKSKYPIRFQMMEQVAGQPLNYFYQNQTLDRKSISRKVGRLLANMHSIKLEGFGFFDTNVLRNDNRIMGLDKSNHDYFYKKLDEHLKFLQDKDFLDSRQTQEIEKLVDKNSNLLDLEQGSVVHKDIAFWNIIGTTDEINAIIDWDDVISGDPADDIAVMRCFYDDDVIVPLYKGYQEVAKISETFKAKTSLYLIRNMLWKAVIRTFMNYFEMKDNLFLLNKENKKSLKQFTYDRLFMGVNELKKL